MPEVSIVGPHIPPVDESLGDTASGLGKKGDGSLKSINPLALALPTKVMPHKFAEASSPELGLQLGQVYGSHLLVPNVEAEPRPAPVSSRWLEFNPMVAVCSQT